MTRPQHLYAIAVCLLAGTGTGCALLKDDPPATTEKSPLRRLSPPIDAVQLEVMFVERPIGDPILGRLLWSQLDQVGTLPASTVANLARNGFRFGIAPTDPPRALQAALGLTGEMVPRDESTEYRVSGRSYARRSGEDLSIETWPAYSQCEMMIYRDGVAEPAKYENARCAFRVQVERKQDGWARLEFIPEVHHGPMRLRSIPDDFNWTTTSSQLVDPQFDQRFEVDLNLGEMVVLGADGDDPRTLGHHFFSGGTTDGKLQRLLIIRLADMQRIDPAYD